MTGPPLNSTLEIAGPEPLGIDELVRRLFGYTGDPRRIVADHEASYAGATLTESALTPTAGADVWIAPTTLDAWLRDHS